MSEVHVSLLANAPNVTTASLTLPPTSVFTESPWSDPRYTLQWPSIPSSPSLSDKISSTTDGWRSDYVKSVSDADHSNLSVVWECVLNRKGIVGIRLHNKLIGGDTAVQSKTLYGDKSHSWTSEDSISSNERKLLVAQLAKQAKYSDTPPSPDKVLTDLTFDSAGNLLVTVPEGALGPMSSGAQYFKVTNPKPILSRQGKNTRSAMMSGKSPSTSGEESAGI